MKRLLESHSLPTADIDLASIEWLVALNADGHLAGMVGFESFDDAGLLRSLVAVRQGQGVGSRLLVAAEQAAAQRGIAQLFLLTQTAREFFASRGYALTDRGDVAHAVLQTHQFRDLCPTWAACMSRKLS